MKQELDAAINELARKDAVVHATMCTCHRDGLSATDTLAHIVLNLAASKAALEATLLELISLSPPRSPLFVAAPPSTLAQQVAGAQAEVATWPQEKRDSVRAAGSSEPTRGSVGRKE